MNQVWTCNKHNLINIYDHICDTYLYIYIYLHGYDTYTRMGSLRVLPSSRLPNDHLFQDFQQLPFLRRLSSLAPGDASR